MTTSIPRPACALRQGDTITRHPDHPERPVRYRVESDPRGTFAGVVVDYSAPAEDLPGCTPNHDRAEGRLVLRTNQPCEIEPPETAGGTP